MDVASLATTETPARIDKVVEAVVVDEVITTVAEATVEEATAVVVAVAITK